MPPNFENLIRTFEVEKWNFEFKLRISCQERQEIFKTFLETFVLQTFWYFFNQLMTSNLENSGDMREPFWLSFFKIHKKQIHPSQHPFRILKASPCIF